MRSFRYEALSPTRTSSANEHENGSRFGMQNDGNQRLKDRLRLSVKRCEVSHYQPGPWRHLRPWSLNVLWRGDDRNCAWGREPLELQVFSERVRTQPWAP